MRRKTSIEETYNIDKITYECLRKLKLKIK